MSCIQVENIQFLILKNSDALLVEEPKQKHKKFYMRAKLSVMCGYAQTTKGYRIWLIDGNRIRETINVRLDESKTGLIL